MRSLHVAALLALAGCQRDDAPAPEATADALQAPDAILPPKASCAPAKSFAAAAWPEADALFHQEPRWLGADAAYSIELAHGRILWLFGDTFIAKTSARVRSASTFIRNSIAIQTGTDPTSSTMAFHWREDGASSSFFPEEGDHWLWPFHGARVGSELVLFLNELKRMEGGLGFATVGSRIVRISNPDADPMTWSFETQKLPADDRSHGVGVVAANGFLYALTTKESAFFDVELERWRVDALDAPGAFWNGKAFGPPNASTPIWKGGAPEFVTAAHCNEWVTVESVGFGATDLAVRHSKALTGGWSAPVKVFQPEESRRMKPFVYAGKFHPELTGADLVATYAANSFDFAEVIKDTTLYRPRFAKITERR